MKTLESKVALVSGGADGIGRAVVERYIAEGAKVAVFDINAEKLESLKAAYPDELITVHGDVTRYEDNERAVAETVAAFGKLDIFVGNAALFDYFVPLRKIAPEQLEESFDKLFHVNVMGYMNGVRAAMAELKKSKGAVVLTVSNSGFYPGGGGILYVTAKHAVVGLIKQLAYEMAPDVRVNGVSPGATDTEMKSVDGISDRAQPLNHIQGFRDNAANAVPLKRIASPADHTAFYVVLASNEQSPMTTGCVIHSDGGWVAR
ncbi:3-(cis-5,6-dihydroxycyclohexa-1,3-dien-1-yl)propanoate dehydrogenase [Marinobacterium mangrovicola]|uniref:NAD(P)-dependent dehydrogenase (Short-subunit alcohol dehydrogenase family) n=1 Tax=Marinobacterium mangrovicola TaxID=1476959 RepID=A0A4R1G9D0_9GAMM|nr:3-(cis-5,6-dihydroxycyclohexa-1,3-dien-1-yl)propanoate dehydrogenase [Marinobacterium mangrovicola]TCK04288.1 NAD(P)-dependent dehydrogenase (short-subunit alcohol dehydrogenase family) [Marinobacterium mangrovicola]